MTNPRFLHRRRSVGLGKFLPPSRPCPIQAALSNAKPLGYAQGVKRMNGIEYGLNGTSRGK
jgi:hypothetical protein